MARLNLKEMEAAKRNLRRKLLLLLRHQGFELGRNYVPTQFQSTKEQVRALHSHARQERLTEERAFIEKWFPRIERYFADGADVVPSQIEPVPVLVDDDELAALFRIAALWWSVPVSKGFGRRFRILVFDRSSEKLMGLLALTDPVFNLRARDNWIGWDVRQREQLLSSVMDAHVLGAIPPYNGLLGAKLMALIAASNHVREIFAKKYGGTLSIIRKRSLERRLALVTVTSALGTSSIYNRLKFGGSPVFESVGFTEGFGHFHLANGNFEQMREIVELFGNAESYKFGAGPNYRIRVVRKALEHLGLPPGLLRHGIRRAVYVAPLAENTAEFLRGEAQRLKWHDRPISAVVNHWRDRWLLPRAERDSSYRDFRKSSWNEILQMHAPTLYTG